MSKNGNFLTKSRFKVGCECPTKLYYLDNKDYGSTMADNSFLAALAEGGFQVGELAKIYHPGAVEITTMNKDEAVEQTNALLAQNEAIIYEAAFRFENLFIRADIVLKKGNSLTLIEVKAKSIDRSEENPFYTKNSLKKGEPKINSEWQPYLLDVAFQKYVIKKAHPKFNVTSSLMLADKTATATVDGLNQLFFIDNSGKRTDVKVAPGTTLASVGKPLLAKITVDDEVAIIWDSLFDEVKTFEQQVQSLSKICADTLFTTPAISADCKSCEFRISSDLKNTGKKSGFEECWAATAKSAKFDLKEPLVFDVWNFRKAAKLMEEGVFAAKDIAEDAVEPTSRGDEPGLSMTERQWLQIEKIKAHDDTPFLDIEGMHQEMKSWQFPLHFIDFETTMVAIPFNKGRRPYEQTAFQFSHHVVEKSGVSYHKSEYINTTKGFFPNFEFVRALKKSLSEDNGTIFRFATHENTVLCQIRGQLLASDEKDKAQLIQFIESITNPAKDAEKTWRAERRMVDMCELVKKYFYHPKTKGSNSIKKVLPAILNESKYLQTKYSTPTYGTAGGVKSKNFKDWTWIQFSKDGAVLDPYKLLPPIFKDLDLETMDTLVGEGSIADGGAAMTSYARMQFTEMSETESKPVTQALLKYCELDTFAMVMIYEYWRHQIDAARAKAA